MEFFVYILYSQQLDKYYVGHTGSSLTDRLHKHLSDHKGFTSNAKDWQIVYRERYQTKNEANQRELNIKRRKSRKYIEGLLRSVG